MSDAVPGDACDVCGGTGMWSGGCDLPDDCWQCHGTGIQRVRGNCEDCLGWGWTFGPRRCETCAETGWVGADVALYRCTTCAGVFAASPEAAVCPRDTEHAITRVSADRPTAY